MVNQPCADGILLDVSLAFEQVETRIHRNRLEPSLPHRAGPSVRLVEVLDVALAQPTHRAGDVLGLVGRDQQVHMIGHQHVRVHVAGVQAARFLEQAKVGSEIIADFEAATAVVSALDDVQRIAGQLQTRVTWHG
jgi:hypothetical protein